MTNGNRIASYKHSVPQHVENTIMLLIVIREFNISRQRKVHS